AGSTMTGGGGWMRADPARGELCACCRADSGRHFLGPQLDGPERRPVVQATKMERERQVSDAEGLLDPVGSSRAMLGIAEDRAPLGGHVHIAHPLHALR